MKQIDKSLLKLKEIHLEHKKDIEKLSGKTESLVKNIIDVVFKVEEYEDLVKKFLNGMEESGAKIKWLQQMINQNNLITSEFKYERGN